MSGSSLNKTRDRFCRFCRRTPKSCQFTSWSRKLFTWLDLFLFIWGLKCWKIRVFSTEKKLSVSCWHFCYFCYYLYQFSIFFANVTSWVQLLCFIWTFSRGTAVFSDTVYFQGVWRVGSWRCTFPCTRYHSSNTPIFPFACLLHSFVLLCLI